MSTPEETDRFVLRKAAARATLGRCINVLLDQWRALPESDLQELHGALIAVLGDLTAEVAKGVRAPTKEQFLQFMERSYDVATTKQEKGDDRADDPVP